MTDREIHDLRNDFDIIAKRMALVAAAHKLIITLIRFKIGNCEKVMNSNIHAAIVRQGH